MMKFTAPARIFGLIYFLLAPIWALDAVDATFAPVIRGPGTVRKLAWHPASAMLYASVSGDKLNGQLLTTSLVRFRADGTWDAGYAPVINGWVVEMSILPDGKIVIAGTFTSVDGHATGKVARLLGNGAVDASFVTSGGTLPTSILDLAVAGDGTIYLGVNATSRSQYVSGKYINIWPKLLFKLSPAGVLDPTFAPEFSMADAVANSSSRYFMRLESLLVTPTGDLIAGGNFTMVNAAARSCLAKLSASGTLDVDYHPALTYVPNQPVDFNNPQLNVVTLADAGGGKHYAGGTFNTVNGSTQKAVIRLDGTGVIDTTFQPLLNSPYYSFNGVSLLRVAVDGAGRVILSGAFETVNGVAKRDVARVDANGLLDGTFSADAPIYGDDFVVLPEDSVLFARSGISSSGGVLKPVVYGAITGGGAVPPFQFDLRKRRYPEFICPRPGNGPLLVSIWTMEVNGVETGSLAAVTPGGQADASFHPALVPAGGIKACLVLPDGRVLMGGYFNSASGLSRPKLALLEPDGTPVANFDLGTGPDSTVDFLRLMPSGKVLVGGSFSKINGETANGVGLLDLTALTLTQGLIVEEILEARYGTDSLFTDVRQLLNASLIDGALVIDINTTSMGGDPAPGSTKSLTVRFRTNRGERTAKFGNASTLRLPNVAWDSGLMDRQFRPANAESPFLNDAGGQPDGKIILLGSFSKFAGYSIPNMIRLWPDGSVDSGFQPASQFSYFSPEVVKISPTGQIYIGDLSLSLVGSSTSRGLYRLTSSGYNDYSFTCLSSINWVYGIELQLDGSVWCVGSFGSTATGERKNVARLLPNGAVDTRFDAGASTDSFTYGLALETPGKLWVHGSFTNVQGVPRDGLALINLASGVPPQAQVVPKSMTITDGTAATFGLTNVGNGETYSWKRNGVFIPGANGPSLTLTSAVPVGIQTYSAQVVNGTGTTSSSGTLTVREATLSEWLASHSLNGLLATADSDGDGVGNASEYLARTDPGDGSSVFAIRMENHVASVRLRWSTYPGRQYFIEQSADLTGWIPVGAAIAGDGGEKVVDVPYDPNSPSLCWRVRLTKP